MQNNITKAFKRKSALRKMVDGGRVGMPTETPKFGSNWKQQVDTGIQGLRTDPAQREAFNTRQAQLNSGIRAGLGDAGEVSFTGNPGLKTNPDQPALTPGLSVMPDGAMLNEGYNLRSRGLYEMGMANARAGATGAATEALRRMDDVAAQRQMALPQGLPPIQNPAVTGPAAPAQPAVTPTSAPTPMFPNTPGVPVDVPQQPTEEFMNPPEGLRTSEEPSLWSKIFGMATGKRPWKLRDGGKVTGPGGPTDDKVGPVMLSHKEYVLPADTAQAIGYENLDAIKDATHTPVKGEKQGLRKMMPHMYGGGRPSVGPMSFYDSPFAQHARNEKALLAQLAQPQQAAGAAPPPAQPAAPAAAPKGSPLRVGRLAPGVAAAAEGLRGYGDYQTLDAAGEGGAGTGAKIAGEGITRVAGAAAGAKGLGALGAMAGPYGRYLAPAGAIVGGLAGYVAPDAIAPFVGYQTSSDKANEVRDENAQRLAADAKQEEQDSQTNPPEETRPMVNYNVPSLRREEPMSNAKEINSQFDRLAQQFRSEHGKRVDTPFGGTTLNRNQQLLELEKARAQALGTDLNSRVSLRGQDINARTSAAGNQAELVKQQMQAQEKMAERQEKSVADLHSNIQQLVGGDEEMQTELFRFATNTDGFMSAFENAPAAARRKMLAGLNEMLPTYTTRLERGLRRGSAVEEGFVSPDRVKKGLTMSDINNTDANAMDYLLRGGLFGGNTEWAQFGGQMIPTKELQKGLRGKDHVNADLVRYIDQYRTQ